MGNFGSLPLVLNSNLSGTAFNMDVGEPKNAQAGSMCYGFSMDC